MTDVNEKELTQIAKRYLEKQGYEIASRLIYSEKGAKIMGVDLSNRDYVIRRMKQTPPTPDDIRLFGKVKVNSRRYLFAGCYPDIIAIKNGKPYMFEVKANVDDRCIQQCLRYVRAYPFFKVITLIVLEGSADELLYYISQYKLPIKVIQLAVPGVTKPNLLPRPRQPPRLLDFPEMPKTVKGLRQLWKERLTKRP